MNRKKRLFLNMVTGVSKQLVTVICGFILPRYILLYYGSVINGIVSSITNYLSFISLLDLGVGAVIQANLYKPLADNDNFRISAIIVASQKFFRRIAYIFLIYIGILAIVLPGIVNNELDFFFTASLVIIIAISTFAQYFFGMTNELLLFADQKSYIPNSVQIGTIILNTVFCIILIKAGASIHAVKLLTAAIYVLRPIAQSIYVKRNYVLDKKIRYEGEPIKQKWNGLSQHFAAVVCEHIDVVLLSIFSSMGNVSVYSVYYMVANGVTMIIMTATNGIESLLGNMIAKNEYQVLRKTFCTIELLVHVLVIIVFSTAAVLIVPFVAIYTKEVNDADYIVPAFGAMLVGAYAARCLRIPYFCIIKAAGHFKGTQNGAFISAGLNIIISLALIFKHGLVGLAFGTFVAMFYHTCYFVWYLQNNILKRNAKFFAFYILSDLLCCSLIVLISKQFIMGGLTYANWIIMAIKTGIVAMAIAVVVNAVLYPKQIKMAFEFLKGKSAG